MRLFDNPIFLTQKRLTHRGGVWAAILISALIGGSLLAGLLVHVTDPRPLFLRSHEAGKMFYAWALGIEAVVLVLGGFAKTVRVLGDERKSGLWDSNRMTPLSPARIVLGYWLGSPLRECYMAATFAGIGLAIVVVGRLPISLWLGTQLMVISTALFFGLLALVIGMAFDRPKSGVALFLPLILLCAFSSGAPKYSVFQFFLPVYAASSLFSDPTAARDPFQPDSYGWPAIFTFDVPPMVLSLGLQLLMGLLLWRAAVRKIGHPSQPLFLRWEAIMIFTVVVTVQHALLWSIWTGSYPTQAIWALSYRKYILPLVHGGSLLVGMLLLAVSSPQPERIRIEALRTGAGPRLAFTRSALPLVLVLAAITGLASLPHFISSLRAYGIIWGLATANLLACFAMFCLLIEYCRLRFRHGAPGFVALGLFVLGVLPLILAALLSSESLGLISFLAPGIMALLEPAHVKSPDQVLLTLIQLGVVGALFLAWWQQWQALFARAPRRP